MYVLQHFQWPQPGAGDVIHHLLGIESPGRTNHENVDGDDDLPFRPDYGEERSTAILVRDIFATMVKRNMLPTVTTSARTGTPAAPASVPGAAPSPQHHHPLFDPSALEGIGDPEPDTSIRPARATAPKAGPSPQHHLHPSFVSSAFDGAADAEPNISIRLAQTTSFPPPWGDPGVQASGDQSYIPMEPQAADVRTPSFDLQAMFDTWLSANVSFNPPTQTSPAVPLHVTAHRQADPYNEHGDAVQLQNLDAFADWNIIEGGNVARPDDGFEQGFHAWTGSFGD